MLSVGIVEKYRELSKVYSGKELVDLITQFVMSWKREMREMNEMREHDKKYIEYENLVSDSGDDDSDSGDYYYIGDVESGIKKVKSVIIGGVEYFVDREKNVYDILAFDAYGLLLQIGTYDNVSGVIYFVDPVTV